MTLIARPRGHPSETFDGLLRALGRVSLGELFYVQCQELEDIAFAWVWEQIVAAFKATLSEDLDLTEEQIDQLFHRFLERIPETIRHRITRFASIGLLKSG